MVSTLTALAWIAAVSARATGDERPDLVVVMCDDMGFSDLGCYGGEVPTPHLDRLAREGLRFRGFYNNAKCEHTRASLLTGHWWPTVGASATAEYARPTFGERLREAGYQTFLAGKWHAGQTPHARGFDRAYGLVDGCCNHWNPGVARAGEPEPARKKVRRWAIDGHEMLPMTPRLKTFHSTDAFTDAAVGFVRGADVARPLLLYLAYTAPHYPLHASREDVEARMGDYRVGWDVIRERRSERQKAIGVVGGSVRLGRRDESVPRWEAVADDVRERWVMRMAAYAAMIEHMDRRIGDVLAALEDAGREDVLVLFLSDNGACDESIDRSTATGAMPWEVTSYLTQGRPWAMASNTPFERYKTDLAEGGIRTPLIAWRPGHVPAGGWTDAVGHVVDVTPTLMELAGLPADDSLPGRSLVATLKEPGFAPERTLFWQFRDQAACRVGDRKWIRTAEREVTFDLSADPTEREALAVDEDLRRRWEDWWGEIGK